MVSKAHASHRTSTCIHASPYLHAHTSHTHSPSHIHTRTLAKKARGHQPVLVRAADEIGHDFVDGSIGDILVRLVSIVAERVGEVVAHAHQLCKANAASLRVNATLLHFLNCTREHGQEENGGARVEGAMGGGSEVEKEE